MIKNKNQYDNVETLKIPPHSIEAEQNVIGAIMVNNAVIDDVMAKLDRDDFYNRSHQTIFGIVKELTLENKPVDLLTLGDRVECKKVLDVEFAYLAEIAKNTTGVSNVNTYANIIKDRSLLRKAIGAANIISEQCYNTDGHPVVEILGNAEKLIGEVSEVFTDENITFDMHDCIDGAINLIEQRLQQKDDIAGLTTGIPDLDNLTNGIEPGDNIILAARPGMGKTTFALNIASHNARKGKRVHIFSLEMPKEQLIYKFIAEHCQVSLKKLQRPKHETEGMNDEDWARVSQAMDDMKKWKVKITDASELSIHQIKLEIRKYRKQHGPQDLIVIDYLQLIKGRKGADNRTVEIGEISRSLKAMAKEFKCGFLTLSQLNRNLEARKDKRPLNSDLRESGEIEQDADKILFIYRDEVYNENTEDDGLAEINVTKCRMGELGRADAVFQGEYSRFLASARETVSHKSEPRQKRYEDQFNG